MTQIIEEMLKNYTLHSKNDYQRAIQEVMQEITLAGLWRAKFFDHAAFYGGTALRILFGLSRFSENLDFSLLAANPSFDLLPFLKAVEEELELSGLEVHVDHKLKEPTQTIQSAFLKAGTLETFIRIGLDEQLKRHVQANEVIKLKLEIDIDPPLNFSTEMHYLTRPFPFAVRSFLPSDLFAGKMHALLCRPYKIRVKGRDWYDFIWYVSKEFPLNLFHLETRMRQSGHYKEKGVLTPPIFLRMLEEKIDALPIDSAKDDLKRFIRNPRELDGWSKELFLSFLPKIHFSIPK